MTPWLVNAVFLAAVAAVALAAVACGRTPRWASVGLAAGVLVLLTIVLVSVLVGTGVIAQQQATGVRVWLAPLEYFAFPLAAAVLLPSLWALLRPASGPAKSSRG